MTIITILFSTLDAKIKFMQTPSILKAVIVGLLQADPTQRYKAAHVVHFLSQFGSDVHTA